MAVSKTWKRLLDRSAVNPGRGGCGVGAVADLDGRASRELVDLALGGLRCLEHRGGVIDGTGDGAGLLLSIDREYFSRFIAAGRHLPEGHALAVGMFFFPLGEPANLPHWQHEIDGILRRAGLVPLGWRHVPVDDSVLGTQARRSRRDVWQAVVGEGMVPLEALASEMVRAKAAIERQVRDCYVVSFSSKTVVYKALATGSQLPRFYPDLGDASLRAEHVVFHRRFSTNTFSNWYLAQVFRLLCHNGEINTIKANRNAVANLEAELGLAPILMPQGSDSSDMDRILELFVSHGVSLLETVCRLMPPAWHDLASPRPEITRFFQGVQRALGSLGAWEGPAALVASDGRYLVGALDRMGLRPLRYVVTHSRRFVLESEIGAVPVPFDDVASTGQLDPGEMIAVDLKKHELLYPDAVLRRIVEETPINFAELSEHRLTPLARPSPAAGSAARPPNYFHQNLFGWTHERTRTARHMAEHGKEPITSMGHDRPLAVLSPLRPPLTKYFKQIVAVVTNPPIDPIREAGAFDLTVHLGASPTVHENTPVYEPLPGYRLPSPVLTPDQLRRLVEEISPERPRARVFDATFADPGNGLVTGAKVVSRRIAELAQSGVAAVKSGASPLLVLTDRAAVAPETGRLPLPMVLVASALHNALVEKGLRRHASILVESGEIQEGHDAAVLIANGATAVCPWLLFEIGGTGLEANLIAVLDETLKRVMSKMGICSIDGYRGSRLFEAVGLAPSVVEHYLPGVVSRLGGLELEDIYEDIRTRGALGSKPQHESDVSVYRKAVWQEMQTTARGHDPEAYGRFLKLIEETPPVYLRDLLRLRTGRQTLPLDRVASDEAIIAFCFRGAAMSHGALHRVAHRAIAAAFNHFGAASNCGEGGEDSRRDRGGPWEESRSRIRQVASGRFGVEARYLAHADELQIKIGQGAKPGEGGMLPAAKVTVEVARIRKTQVGVTLISPPPHHDIYSIEDLAQLVYNLRQANPRARVSVKIPAVTDIGTIAVGIAKAGADVIDISGFEGGTGAASSSSIEHAGLPLERALSEVHQALVINGIRDRVRLRADGGIKTGFDVAAVLALGANEVSLGTSLMIAEQCIFCHGCAAGFCPAGITTQDDVIARRLMTEKKGRPKADQLPDEEEERYVDAKAAVERYLLALARDLRNRLASLGLSHPSELVGRVDLLERKPEGDLPMARDLPPRRIAKVDLAEVLAAPDDASPPVANSMNLPIDVTSELNGRLIGDASRTCAGESVALRYPIHNTDRAVGATLASKIALGEITPPQGGFTIDLVGYGGQALGFGCVEGMRLRLEGFANDTVGEGMSGGTVVVRVPRNVPGSERGALSACGNAAAYGATGGRLFIEGRAGQRVGVRNSGATLVVEGAGKYAFEYMTGGVGVVLGPLGPVACSGMTGGVVYALDEVTLAQRVHRDAKIAPLSDADAAALRDILAEHVRETGSVRASVLLESWPVSHGRFVKLIPAS